LSLLDELKIQRLQGAVTAMERLVAEGGSVNPSSLASSLAGMRDRLSDLEEGTTSVEDREKKKDSANLDLAVAVAVARETALSDAEKDSFADFLSKSYFTKQDFGALGEFYRHSYDKLSDDGKAEMSHRLWEGIRRGEYHFSELPEDVRKRDADRLAEVLASQSLEDRAEAQIPEQDRQEFLEAHRKGDTERVAKILDREVFRQNTSTNALANPSNEREVASTESQEAHDSLLDNPSPSNESDELTASMGQFTPPTPNASGKSGNVDRSP